MEPEELEQAKQHQRRRARAKAAAAVRTWWYTAGNRSSQLNSADELAALAAYLEHEKKHTSQDDSSLRLPSHLLLQGLLSGSTASSSSSSVVSTSVPVVVEGEQQPEQRPDRRRCDSAGDRLTTGGTATGGMGSIIGGMPSMFTGGKPIRKQKNQCCYYYPGGAPPKDVEIKVDLERVLPPVEEAVAEIEVIV